MLLSSLHNMDVHAMRVMMKMKMMSLQLILQNAPHLGAFVMAPPSFSAIGKTRKSLSKSKKTHGTHGNCMTEDDSSTEL